MSSSTPNRNQASKVFQSKALTSEPWMWIFILADMSVFALFFGVYLWELRGDRTAFARDAAELTLSLGLFNTLTLLTSSYVVVSAVRAHRLGNFLTTLRSLNLALAAAAVFTITKVTEYLLAVVNGHGLTTSPFFMYYFVLTGLHLMHVAIGSVLLAFWRRSLNAHAKPVSIGWMESAAGYWHMVDLLWIIIFSFVYVVSHK